MRTRFLIRPDCKVEIIQTDVTTGHIVKNDSDRVRILIPMRPQMAVGALVAFQRLGESILPIEDVSGIQLDPGEAPFVTVFLENCAGLLSGRICAVIFAQKNQRLNRRA
jgi:hypothetical protein